MERTNDKLVAAFADVLRQHRVAAGLSQEELAHRAEVSTRFVSFLETRRRQPTLTAFASLATGLGMPLSKLAEQVELRWKDTGSETGGD